MRRWSSLRTHALTAACPTAVETATPDGEPRGQGSGTGSLPTSMPPPTRHWKARSPVGCDRPARVDTQRDVRLQRIRQLGRRRCAQAVAGGCAGSGGSSRVAGPLGCSQTGMAAGRTRTGTLSVAVLCKAPPGGGGFAPIRPGSPSRVPGLDVTHRSRMDRLDLRNIEYDPDGAST